MGMAANGNGGVRKFLGGAVAGSCAAIVVGLLALGGERTRVLDHVATTEPLRQAAAIHIVDQVAHLDAAEAATVAVVPLRLDQIDRQITEINRKLDVLLRQTR